jgi:hypothetical protein
MKPYLESIVGHGVAPVGEDEKVDLPVANDRHKGFAVKVLLAVFISSDDPARLLSKDEIALLVGIQELGSFRVIRQDVDTHDTDSNGSNALNNEDLILRS